MSKVNFRCVAANWWEASGWGGGVFGWMSKGNRQGPEDMICIIMQRSQVIVHTIFIRYVFRCGMGQNHWGPHDSIGLWLLVLWLIMDIDLIPFSAFWFWTILNTSSLHLTSISESLMSVCNNISYNSTRTTLLPSFPLHVHISRVEGHCAYIPAKCSVSVGLPALNPLTWNTSY